MLSNLTSCLLFSKYFCTLSNSDLNSGVVVIVILFSELPEPLNSHHHFQNKRLFLSGGNFAIS
ncbi:hypothetical protein [Malacoplasma iowae]|uniref:Uncharacterized protein n=1 Tax=Malacoplasma iowae 695 TaxID=1048830 RepID=A0A9J7BZD8_MALIO|nr:hypothetical protein [Malacoplasma iowae]UYS84742.1 hypothetical protein EER00_05410 [Malacoplasma iowae 695]